MIDSLGLNPFFSLILVVGLLFVTWVIVSLPIYIASRVIVPGKAHLGKALVCSALGTIVFFLLSFLFAFLSPLLGVFIGFLGLLAVIAMVYAVGFLKAFGIALVAFIVFVVVSIIFALLGVAFFAIL